MEILKTPLSKQSTQINKGLILAFTIVSFLGFLDATFLTAEHYLGLLLGCPIFGGCDKVISSPYSVVWGIPVALAGAVYYLAVFLLSVAYFDTKQVRPLEFAVYLTPLGLIASLWFLYLQAVIINALCFYCLISALTSTLLFIFGLLLRRRLQLLSPIC